MIENEIKQQEQIKTGAHSAVSSPISKSGHKNIKKQENGFVAWLNDKDVVDEKNGEIDAKVAITSFIKGLAEIVKTVCKRPIASVITVAVAAALTYKVGFSAVTAVMGVAVAAGVAGIIYAVYSLINTVSSNDTKQSYEVLGISTFILAVGIYGLIF